MLQNKSIDAKVHDEAARTGRNQICRTQIDPNFSTLHTSFGFLPSQLINVSFTTPDSPPT